MATPAFTALRANVPVPLAAPMPLFFAKFFTPPSLATPDVYQFFTPWTKAAKSM
jgi:hypothetical protein